MERKDFLSKILVGGSVLLTTPMILNSCGGGSEDDVTDGMNNGGNTTTTIDLNSSTYAALGTIGGYAYKGNIIIIRTGESQYTALTKVCTHQGCTVEFNSSANQIQCPCHQSAFTIAGAVINGPATSALKKYSVSISGSTLTIM